MKTATRILGLVLLLPALARAQPGPAPALAEGATVADAYGAVQKRVTETPENWVPLSVGDLLPAGSAVRTSEHAGLLLLMPGRHALRVGENTRIELKEVGRDRSYFIRLIGGEIWSFVNKAMKPTRYEVETPSTILGVSGTLFSISFIPGTKESDISCDEGVVSLRQGEAVRSVSRGFAVRVHPDRLGQAWVWRQDQAMRRMWTLFRSREKWTRPGAAMKINRALEADVRTLRQEHERQVQRQQESQHPKPKKAPPKKPSK